MKKITLLVVIAVLMSLFTAQYALGHQQVVAVASVAAQDATPTPAAEEATEVAADEAMAHPSVEIPFLSAWMNSPHANAESYSFRRWDTAEPAEVPVTCAKCHSTPGMIDYLGADGSEPYVVNQPVPVGSVVECMACHNDVAVSLDTVTMPSGLTISNLGHEAVCMECHQGRASQTQVLAAIERVGADDLDAVNADLTFINIHYYAAAATKYGTWAKGGFEYPGQMYDAFFLHAPGVSACTDCHSPHTTELDLQLCATCHQGVESVEDLHDIRMAGSMMDYDGDGDIEEGMYYELKGMQEILFASIKSYAAEVVGMPLGYTSEAHPYFFNDTNEDGEITEDEAVGDNRYASWTPRLLQAAFNYQVSKKDPGSFAHGGKYIVQLVYDSIADLNSALAEEIDISAMHRTDAGHFDGSQQAFRYWDAASGAVPGTCAKCHTADGLPFFLGQKVSIQGAPSNSLECSTCHTDLTTWELYAVEAVEFPSGAVLSSDGAGDNLCMNCHSGRASGKQIETRVANLELDEVAASLSFVNPHYFAAAATRYGSDANGAYQYEDKEYFGYFAHVRRFDSCTECHNAHQLTVDWQDCADCHDGVAGPEDLVNIREYEDDFDGDGDTAEGIAGEIDTMVEMLYEAIRAYAAETAGAAIVYDSHSHPYFFTDVNGDGIRTEDEGRYTTWTPRLLKAAYNYQYAQKDPGAYTHNGQYIIQVLYDSLEDLGVDVSGMVRP